MRHHAFAAAMGLAVAAFLAPGSHSQAASADPTGYWMKPDAERESKIQVFKCGSGKKLLCAKIAWLKNPQDSKGRPLHDIRNENPSLRDRPIVGLTIFTGLAPSAPSTWTGKIYNPEDGHTYSATLTVLSRKEIKLRGCKAWLLCGEKQWLRTTAPAPDVIEPAAPAEGTQQIEASVTPSTPPVAQPEVQAVAAAEQAAAPEAAPSVEAAVPDLPENAQEQVQAAAEPEAPAPQQTNAAKATPVALLTEEIATPAAAPAEHNWRRGYRFINVSTAPDTTGRLSGENVSSMFVLASPIATGPSATSEPGETTAAIEPVPLPQPKPKVKAKPVMATAAAKPAPQTAVPAKPAGQGAPAPQEAAQTDADGADAAQAETADAAMAEEAVPLTRRQKRLLRKQQHQQEPFLPWLR
jgi:uncharacterized protein (DUF2147 family)